MIEPLCRNRNIVVLGSGPNFDASYKPVGLYIAANGAAALQDCHILCTTAHLFRDGVTGPEFETRRSLIARQFSSIWMDTKGSTLEDALSALRRHNVAWTTFHNCEPSMRKIIVRGVCGQDLWVSTGVFAVCLAVYSGAKTVRTNGISLQDGHTTGDDLPRMHIGEDRQCLNLLQDSFPGLILQESLCEQI